MSLLGLLQTGCLIAFAGLLVVAAWRDLRTMRIENSLSLAIMAVFAIWAAAGLLAGSLAPAELGLAVAGAGALFLVAAAAFAAGTVGGGDVKLLAATALFAGPSLVMDFLFVTAVTGGVLGVAVLAGAPIGTASGRGTATLRDRLRVGLPYGPAIAVGGLWVAAVRAAG